MEIVKDDAAEPLSEARSGHRAEPPVGRWERLLQSWGLRADEPSAADRDPCAWMHREART